MFNSHLTAFVCVADSGSFNKAAEKMFISSTAVMKQINALEKHLEMKLFDRTNHGITLTPAGKVIYRHAKMLFEYSKKAVEEARRETKGKNGLFRVGTSLLNPCRPFMDLWYQCNSHFPDYRIHVVPFEDDHSNILSEIARLGDKFDFLVAACDSRQWLNRCNFFPLGVYRQCVAVPWEHELSKRKKISVEDLSGETLMMVKRGDSPNVDKTRDMLETYPLIHIEDTPQFYDMEVFNHCVQTGRPMLTLECWKDVHPCLATIPVDWEFTLPYGILYQLHPKDEVRELLRVMRNITDG